MEVGVKMNKVICERSRQTLNAFSLSCGEFTSFLEPPMNGGETGPFILVELSVVTYRFLAWHAHMSCRI